jgi:hypothetical protein
MTAAARQATIFVPVRRGLLGGRLSFLRLPCLLAYCRPDNQQRCNGCKTDHFFHHEQPSLNPNVSTTLDARRPVNDQPENAARQPHFVVLQKIA